MNIFGSLLGSSNPLLSLGLAFATGGASAVVMEVAKMAVSQIAQNVVQNLGLPPQMTAMLNQAIESKLGPGLPGKPETNEGIADMLSEALGLDLQDVQGAVNSMDEHMSELMQKLIGDEEENRKGGSQQSAKGSGGWIMALAEKMGEIVDKQFENWEAQAEKVADLQKEATAEGSASETAKRDLPSETVVMSAELQKFNMLMQAANSGIKTAGQSAAALAGRQ